MDAIVTELGFKVNRNRYDRASTISGMGETRLRDILRANVRKLLVHKGAREDSAAALRGFAGVGSASQAILDDANQTDFRLSTVEKIAKGFGVKEAWHLLDPAFSPPITSQDLASVDAAREALRVLTPAQRAVLLQSDEVRQIISAPEAASLEKEPR